MDIGIALAPSLDTPNHIRIAESLGYSKAWCFCSPAIYVDTFTMLGLAAERTERIGLGPGVMVPHLRHVADAATAVATLEALAPGRVTAVIGSGFSATALLNRKSVPWTEVEAYAGANPWAPWATVFTKTKPRERTEIDRARRAMQRCIDEGHLTPERNNHDHHQLG